MTRRPITVFILLFCCATPALAQVEKTTRLFDSLMGEYDRLLDRSKDRISRSLIVASLARVPRADAATKLLDLAADEKEPLVRLVAWQALLGRAATLSPDDHRRWTAVTAAMVKADLFRGKTRVPAINVLATAAPDRALKDAWLAMYNHATGGDDVQGALAACLLEWRSPDIVDALIGKLAVTTAAGRADHMLQLAGSPAVRGGRGGPAGHARWWAQERREWKEKAAAVDGSWRKLAPQFIPAPVAIDAVDPGAVEWQKDLDLKTPDLRAFDLAFVIDATESMDVVFRWLKRDVGRLLKGFGAVALEPRIGLTFYRDSGDQSFPITRPMTSKVDVLVKQLGSMTAENGGDEPEAVLDGLRSCYEKNKWSTAPSAHKVVVLVGDAPPKPRTQKVAERLVKDQAAKGFRLYAIKCSPGLPEFDALAAAGSGVSMEVRPEEIRRAAGDLPEDLIDGLTATANQTPAGLRLMTQVLVDLINPQYRERIEPVVAILWEILDDGPAKR